LNLIYITYYNVLERERKPKERMRGKYRWQY